MLEGMKFQIEQSGMKTDDSGFDEDKAKEEWRSKAENNCKGYILLENIGSLENIHVSQFDLEEEFKTLAEQSKQKLDDVKNRMMANPGSDQAHKFQNSRSQSDGFSLFK